MIKMSFSIAYTKGPRPYKSDLLGRISTLMSEKSNTIENMRYSIFSVFLLMSKRGQKLADSGHLIDQFQSPLNSAV